MDKKEAIKLIEPIFKRVFDDDKLEINENSNSDNIDSWDSFNHIILVVEIEKNWILASPMVKYLGIKMSGNCVKQFQIN